jgi:hypothetical protein
MIHGLFTESILMSGFLHPDISQLIRRKTDGFKKFAFEILMLKIFFIRQKPSDKTFTPLSFNQNLSPI